MMRPLHKTVLRGEPSDTATWDDEFLEVFEDELGRVPARKPQVADACGYVVVWMRERR